MNKLKQSFKFKLKCKLHVDRILRAIKLSGFRVPPLTVYKTISNFDLEVASTLLDSNNGSLKHLANSDEYKLNID